MDGHLSAEFQSFILLGKNEYICNVQSLLVCMVLNALLLSHRDVKFDAKLAEDFRWARVNGRQKPAAHLWTVSILLIEYLCTSKLKSLNMIQ